MCSHSKYGSYRGKGHFGGSGPCKDQNCLCGAFNADHETAGTAFDNCPHCTEKRFRMRHWDTPLHHKTRAGPCEDGVMPDA